MKAFVALAVVIVLTAFAAAMNTQPQPNVPYPTDYLPAFNANGAYPGNQFVQGN